MDVTLVVQSSTWPWLDGADLAWQLDWDSGGEACNLRKAVRRRARTASGGREEVVVWLVPRAIETAYESRSLGYAGQLA
jgi:hypothetical protein